MFLANFKRGKRFTDEGNTMSYEHDFMGIPANIRGNRGMDPNHRGGYGGMRMRGDGWQAAYGEYRWRHGHELGGQHGPRGRYERDFRPLPRGYDRGIAGGGVRARRDPEMIRTFNAESEYLREGGHRDRGASYDRGLRGGPRHRLGNDPGYTNRGLSSAGYGEQSAGRLRPR